MWTNTGPKQFGHMSIRFNVTTHLPGSSKAEITTGRTVVVNSPKIYIINISGYN